MIEPGEINAVLLAAGLSRRFGDTDKLAAPYEGKPLALHAADLLAAIPFGRRTAVCRPGSALVPLLEVRGFTIVLNPAPQRGMGSSLALAAKDASRTASAALMVLLADMPGVTSAHLMRLIAAFGPARDLVASTDGSAPMPPALLGRRHFADLAALAGDTGARALLAGAGLVGAPPAELIDIDHPDQVLRRARPARAGIMPETAPRSGIPPPSPPSR